MQARVLTCIAVFSVLFSISAAVAQTIPPGTALPVMLDCSLDVRHDKPGKTITAKLMQDVPLSDGAVLPKGARLTVQVISASPATPGSPSRLAVKVDRIVTGRQHLVITTHLRALGSANAVFEAKLPTNAIADYGTSTSDWNTVQIGGAGVYRGSGVVVDGDRVIGETTDYGAVTAKLVAVPRLECRPSEREQALWLFSPSACGIYGYDDLKVVHRGDTPPVGEIELESGHDIRIEGGSGWLLRTGPTPD